MVYAGGYLLFFGINDALTYNVVPKNFDYLAPSACYDGLVVRGEIYQTVGRLPRSSEYVTPSVLGIPIGKEIVRRFYMIPLGVEEDVQNQLYLLVCVSDEEDVELLESLEKHRPALRDPDAPAMKFRGTMARIDDGKYDAMVNYIMEHHTTLAGIEWGVTYGDMVFRKHIVPYAVYVDNRESADYSSIIIGGVLVVVGIALAAVLILRIKGEREGY